MDVQRVLANMELFQGLEESELAEIAGLCHQLEFEQNQIVMQQGNPGDAIFIITSGLLEVSVYRSEKNQAKTMVHLGPGQILGEMALLDQGQRSATVRVRSSSATLLQISYQDLDKLFELNYRLGYQVMRNLARDLSFKLRHQNLLG